MVLLVFHSSQHSEVGTVRTQIKIWVKPGELPMNRRDPTLPILRAALAHNLASRMSHPLLSSSGRRWGREGALKHGLVGNFKHEKNIQPRLI